MAGLSRFDFYPRDWFLDTRDLSNAAKGVYIDLLATNDLGLTMEGPIDTLVVDDSAEVDDSLALLTSTSLTGLGMPSVNEIQTLRIDATGGLFQLSFMGFMTALLDHDISGDNLQLELEGLESIGEGNIRVDQNDDVFDPLMRPHQLDQRRHPSPPSPVRSRISRIFETMRSIATWL